MDGKRFVSEGGSLLSTAHTCTKRCAVLKSHDLCSGTMYSFQGAAVRLIRGAEVPGMMFWHGSGPSRRNSNVDSGR
eukprot:408528-Pyramimonas_sp.AAC.1